MNHDLLCLETTSSSHDATARLAMLPYDTTSIDGDIEMALSRLQKRHSYTRAKANVELVRRLSFAA